MTTLAIFLLGVLVTGVTFTAVLLVGLHEAADSAHSRFEDLSSFERSVVNRDSNDDPATDSSR
jgi:hypothetical protein